jgi:hypothetical protein
MLGDPALGLARRPVVDPGLYAPGP